MSGRAQNVAVAPRLRKGGLDVDSKRWTWKAVLASGIGLAVVLALVRLVLYVSVGNRYGFHRDELQFFDDARYLAWGYVPYPPLAPAVARLARELFGPSLAGLRFFSALTQALAMVVTAMVARELGGRRLAQVVAALAVAIAPMSAFSSATFMYISFDYLWWLLVAYFVIRLLKSEDPRWWLAIGAVIGVGMMTKYTMAFWTAGLVAGVLLTGARRYLAGKWLWAGAALAFILFLPNFVWQVQHNFISVDFLGSIHVRDIAEGRMDNFLLDQLLVGANIFTTPLWIAGLYYFFFTAEGRRYRLIGWMAVITFLLFLVTRGRGYYTAGLYPPLLAAGACLGEQWLDQLSGRRAAAVRATAGALLVAGTVFALGVTLPIYAVNSAGWNATLAINGDVKEEIGWPDMVHTIGTIYQELPADQRARTGVLAGNYGEAGALALYGPAYGLPEPISGINTYWLRGYGDPPPEKLIVVGFDQATANRHLDGCRVVGANTNSLGVLNEESVDHPLIFLCGPPRKPWAEFWKDFHWFG